VPGRSTLVAELPAGEGIGDSFELSPDGAVFAYEIEDSNGANRLALTFLNDEPNSIDVFKDTRLTDYRPTELAFSDDGSLLAWNDDGAASEPSPIRAVAIDAATATLGSVVLVSNADFAIERVSEFDIKPGSNTLIAYRAFEAGSTLPADTLLRDLSTADAAIKLNNGASSGALFTSFEDVLWRGDTVLFNSAEDQSLRADLFSVGEDDPGNASLLTRQVPFATERTNSAAGVSHFLLSPDNNKTAMIDGDPALDLFVIDRFNIGTSVAPFEITATRSIDSLTDPNVIPPQFNGGSDMLGMVITEQLPSSSEHNNLYVASSTISNSEVPVLNTESPQVFDFVCSRGSEL